MRYNLSMWVFKITDVEKYFSLILMGVDEAIVDYVQASHVYSRICLVVCLVFMLVVAIIRPYLLLTDTS